MDVTAAPPPLVETAAYPGAVKGHLTKMNPSRIP